MTTTRIRLCDSPVDLMRLQDALELISSRFTDAAARPLGVASVNLDHLYHFGNAGDGHGVPLDDDESAPVEWLHLIDGAPIAAAASRTTHDHWPRLAGSDLIDPILACAGRSGATVGFLGGFTDTHAMLVPRLAVRHPSLRLVGCWAPAPTELADDDACRVIAGEIAARGVDVLVVCLGKPRQEHWIEQYGPLTGAHVLLAFGAVVDFLSGRIRRAPRWVADHGFEWAWRLGLEPRRLASRYLVRGPVEYVALRRSVTTIPGDAAAMSARALRTAGAYV